MLDWLSDLVTAELNEQIPALTYTGPDSITGPATIADSLGINKILTGDNSINSLLLELQTGNLTPTPELLAEQLNKTEVQLFLNLPQTHPLPANPVFNSADPASYNFTTDLKVFDATGAEHDATLYYINTAMSDQWDVRLWVDGAQLGSTFQLEFSATTDQLVSPSDGLVTLADFMPTGVDNAIDIILDLTGSTQRNDDFKSGWTTWSIAAEGAFEQPTGVAELSLKLSGLGSTGDRMFDFSEAFAPLGASISSDIEASADVAGTLDFSVMWETASTKPLTETLTLQLNDFSADVDVLVDTIQLEAKLGLLRGAVIDSGTQSNPGPNNSYIIANAGFDVELFNGQEVVIGELDTLSVGDDYTVTVNTTLDGVLNFETTLANLPIAGGLQLLIGLDGQNEPTITPIGELDSILDQLSDIQPKQIADVVSQLADWFSSLGNVGALKDSLPLGGGSFGNWADLGDALNQLLFDDFHQVLLVAETPPTAIGSFTDATTFELTISDNSTIDITLTSDVTSANANLNDLAIDLSAAIAEALDSTELAGAIMATVVEGKLALQSTSADVNGIRVANADGQTTPGVERLGFGNGQAVDKLRLETLQDLEDIINEALSPVVCLVELRSGQRHHLGRCRLPGRGHSRHGQHQHRRTILEVSLISSRAARLTSGVAPRVALP